MNPTYVANFLVLSVVLVLVALEVGIAILLLSPFKKYKRALLRYLTPIWEIEGTFIVFFLVNFEASYPTLLGLLANVYVFPALMAGLFITVRNSFLAYSEYIGVEKEDRYRRVYAVATLLMAFFVSIILGSALSGVGINVSNSTPNLLLMFFNPSTLLVFVAIALLGVGAAGIVFRVTETKYSSLAMLALAAALIFVVVFSYAHYAIANAAGYYYMIALLAVLFVVACVLQIMNSKKAGYLALIWMLIAFNVLGVLCYPNIFGGKLNLLNYLNNGAVAGITNLITLVGGSLVAVALVYFVYISYVKKSKM